MASFNTAQDLTAKNEGGYTNNPDDNGNWTGGKKGIGSLVGTNWGISAPVLKEYLHREIEERDMRGLTHDVARKIYKKNYWDLIKGDEINSQALANSIYDSAVNLGPGSAIKQLQLSMKLKDTGIMDVITLNKLNNK